MTRTRLASTSNGGSLSPEQVTAYNQDGYIILENLLSDEDMAQACEAMTQKVDEIAAKLLEDGKISNLLADRPFKYRLAELFASLGDEDFLHYGRSWRDRLPGYFHLMSNPRILEEGFKDA
jgi:hypothetical protein